MSIGQWAQGWVWLFLFFKKLDRNESNSFNCSKNWTICGLWEIELN